MSTKSDICWKSEGVSICSHLFRLLFVSLDTFAVDITIEYLKVELAEGVLNQNSYTMVKFNAMKTKPLRLLRQKRASWAKSVFVLTCLLLNTSVAMAQTKTVTGTVTDPFNEPLIGASILVKGTSTGAVTDMDGKYSISVSSTMYSYSRM